jgi:23S rRNA pseudoU1915 N3-methylase RlmH
MDNSDILQNCENANSATLHLNVDLVNAADIRIGQEFNESSYSAVTLCIKMLRSVRFGRDELLKEIMRDSISKTQIVFGCSKGIKTHRFGAICWVLSLGTLGMPHRCLHQWLSESDFTDSAVTRRQHLIEILISMKRAKVHNPETAAFP